MILITPIILLKLTLNSSKPFQLVAFGNIILKILNYSNAVLPDKLIFFYLFVVVQLDDFTLL